MGGSQAKSGKLYLEKIDKLSDDDKDLPKNEMIGLSRHEFFDTILSISQTKYGLDYEYQFICIDKLLTDHIDAYIYKNMITNSSNTMEQNKQIKKKMREKNLTLRKLFKIYASLDSDESADDDGLGEDEWCTFAVDLCKTAKLLNKKIWINGGKPTFSEMKAAFILSKSNVELDQDEVDYVHFQKCIINLTNIIFKYQPNAKYKILPFEEKLDLVLLWLDKMNKTRSSSLRKRSSSLKKIKSKTIPKIEPTNNNTITLKQ